MKVAIVHPTSWPQVRRGTERFMNELAQFLSGRGHEVTVVTGKMGRKETKWENGYVTEYHRSYWHPAMARFGLLDFHLFPLTTLPRLLREKFDIVHCFNFTDALVAGWARPFTGGRVILHLGNIPPAARYRRELSASGRILKRAAHTADEVVTVSRAQREIFSNRCGRGGVLLRVPVDTETFRLSRTRDSARPVILCASALQDRRKGRRILMRAFNGVKRVRPSVRLQISASLTRELTQKMLQIVEPVWRADVEFLGAGAIDDLPGLLRRASVLVLPSLWEASPLIVTEALATGTPVVGTHEGGIPELISSPELGRTFDPGPADSAEPSNTAGLIQAILETLDLSALPETALHCRAAAMRFSWSVLGPVYEDLYRRVLSGRHSIRNAAQRKPARG